MDSVFHFQISKSLVSGKNTASFDTSLLMQSVDEKQEIFPSMPLGNKQLQLR